MPTLDTSRPFTCQEALSAGLTWGQLRGPRFRRLHPSVYVATDRPLDLRDRAEAALLSMPTGTVLSHHTAARLLDLPVPASDVVHVTVAARGDHRDRDGVRVHRQRSAPTRQVAGLPVLGGPRLLEDLARSIDLVDLVAVGDAMLRRRQITTADVSALVATTSSRRLRRAATLMRPRVDSATETRLRLLLVLAGMPEPEVNVEVHHPDGRVRYRFDLSYPALRLAIEYDGRHHRDDLDQWDHDLDRDAWLAAHGWERVVVIARGLHQRPEETLRRVREAVVRRGGDVPPEDPAWRQYFERT